MGYAGSLVRRRRRLWGVALVLAALAAGCDTGYLLPDVEVAVDVSGRTAALRVDAETTERVTVALNAFLPEKVTARPGDTVQFRLDDSGSPHTLTLGRLADAAVAAVVPGVPAAETAARPELTALPHPFRYTAPGAVEVDPVAAEPCEIGEGAELVPASCGEPGSFDGTEVLHSSGLLSSDEVYELELSASLAPASFSLICLVHRQSMTATLQVAEESQSVPPMRTVRDEGIKEADALVSSVEQAVVRPDAPAVVDLGAPGPRGRGFVADFVPGEVQIEAGATVTWRVRGLHAVAFRPPGSVRDPWRVTPDGVEITEQAWEPSTGVVWPAELTAWPPPPAAVVVDGGSWDGEGFHTSGILRADVPLDVTYTLAVTEPGTYEMRCLVHDEARARLVVG